MDEVEVEIESHGCQIESLNNEEIVCQVERTAHKETISNLGTTGTLQSDTKVSQTDRTADILKLKAALEPLVSFNQPIK